MLAFAWPFSASSALSAVTRFFVHGICAVCDDLAAGQTQRAGSSAMQGQIRGARAYPKFRESSNASGHRLLSPPQVLRGRAREGVNSGVAFNLPNVQYPHPTPLAGSRRIRSLPPAVPEEGEKPHPEFWAHPGAPPPQRALALLCSPAQHHDYRNHHREFQGHPRTLRCGGANGDAVQGSAAN